MKKSKKITSNLIKLIISVLIVLFLLLGPIVVFNKNNYTINIDKLLGNTKQSTVLELWHIETFEGGSVSRAQFLQKQAVNFNKQNQGDFVIIKTLTATQAQLNLEQNYQPDLVSFGVGAGELFVNILQELNTNDNIRKDLLPYGKASKQQLALPYMLGGYAMITYQDKVQGRVEEQDLLNNAFNLSYKQGKKTIPSLVFAKDTSCDIAQVLVANNVAGNKQDFLDNTYTTYQAYESFVNSNAVSLVGTQRDVVRCLNREQNGKIDACYYTYLSGYSDLVQYIGVLDNQDQAKTKVAKDFVEFLTSEQVQQNIKNISMFSVLNQPIYDNQDDLFAFEKALQKPLTSVSVFASNQVLQGNKANSWRNLGIL